MRRLAVLKEDRRKVLAVDLVGTERAASTILVGQRTTAGSRTPPSHVVVLPSRNKPELPPDNRVISHGPLSDVKNVIVVSSATQYDMLQHNMWPDVTNSTASPNTVCNMPQDAVVHCPA